MVHYSAKYNSEDNLLEDKNTFRSRVNETKKPFKDRLGYPSNPPNPSYSLNPPSPPSLSNASSPLYPPNPLSPSNPPSPSHLPNPRFKDSLS